MGGLPNRHISLSETEVLSYEYYCCSICWSMFYTRPYWRHFIGKLQLFISVFLAFGGRNSNYLNCKKLNFGPKAMLPLEIMLINVLHLSLLKTLYRKTTAIYKFFLATYKLYSGSGLSHVTAINTDRRHSQIQTKEFLVVQLHTFNL